MAMYRIFEIVMFDVVLPFLLVISLAGIGFLLWQMFFGKENQ